MKRLKELCCLFTISFLTILLARKCSLFNENFTALLNTNQSFWLFIWGTVANFATMILLNELIKLIHKKYTYWLCFTFLCLPLSLLFPFTPQTQPLSTALHLLFSYLYFISFNAIIIHILYHCTFLYPFIAPKFKNIYFLILGVCAIIFAYYMSINALFEVVFTLSISLFLWWMIHTLDKQSRKNS